MGMTPPVPDIFSPKRDWRITAIGIVSAVLLLCMLVTVPAAVNASNTSVQLSNSQNVLGCRAVFNAKVTDANTTLTSVRVESELLQNQFLIAVTQRKSDIDFNTAFADINTRLDSAGKAVQSANNANQAAIRFSIADPKKFLKTPMCKSR